VFRVACEPKESGRAWAPPSSRSVRARVRSPRRRCAARRCRAP